MIRVAHVINELEVGGAETQLVHLLRRIDRARFQPSVVYLFGEGTLAPALRDAGVETRTVRLSRWNAPLALARLVRCIRSLEPDVVHLHLVHATVLGMMSRALAGRPASVVTRHSAGSKPRDLAGRLEPAALRRADRVIAVSETVARAVAGLGRPASGIEVIPNGLDIEWFDRAAAVDDKRWPARGEGEVRVGALGNWRRAKGLDLLVAAIGTVRARRPGVRLWIGGPVSEDAIPGGPAGLGDAVGSPRGVLVPDEVPAFLTRLDVFVQPSREESFGLSALEAMAAGKPVVATAVGGLTGLVRDGETGLLAEPESPEALAAALLRLVDDADLRDRMGRAGRARAVAEFSIEATVGRLERLYTDLAETHRTRDGRRDVRDGNLDEAP